MCSVWLLNSAQGNVETAERTEPAASALPRCRGTCEEDWQMSCPAVVQGKPNAINNLQWLARHRWYKASVVHYCVYYCESLKFWCCHTQLVSSCFYETCIFLCWRHGPKIKSNLQRQQMEVSRRKLGISLQQSLGWNSRKSHTTSINYKQTAWKCTGSWHLTVFWLEKRTAFYREIAPKFLTSHPFAPSTTFYSHVETLPALFGPFLIFKHALKQLN